MKIKDIRQFRTFFKKNVRETEDTNRDEHFVGTNHFDEVNQKTVFGFFDLYHGQKSKGVVDGIKGFLKGFLDMAQDAQAVYEFLQNAVDANSSHFIMVWGEDETELNEEGKPVEYLLVINNGWQFDFPAIQSILNVGVSTKTEDEHTIGKFGIGFKLAHRLVGKENGLDELLDKNYGPVLFSWKNGELRNLIKSNVESVVPVAQEYSIERKKEELKVDIITHEPWLFKILITNFPTQPNELIRDAYYAEKNDAFTQSDVRKLGTWLSKFKNVIPVDDYDTGSLFFLKLGTDKSHVLGDKNLEEGIRFSLSILNKVADSKVNGLQHVHLNGTDIKNAPLEFKSFIIPKDSEKYRYIRFGKKEALTPTEQAIADKDSDIQFLFGFTDYINAIKLIDNVPNFYLYFPLSEEKHKLKFILHSNAFYKKSARTSLHSDALNVRLLEVFAQKLVTYLTSCFANTNEASYSDFLAIYPLLLLSEESNDADKRWINEPLISNIRDFVKTNIPVVANTPSGFEIESDPLKVKIKSTKLQLNPAQYNLPYEWFYWSDDEMLSNAAISTGLGWFSILELLYEPGVAQKINKEFELDANLLPIILDEINTHIHAVTGSGKDAETFKDNFYELKLFSFDDSTLQCINELNDRASEKKYLLLFEEIEPIKDLLRKAGFICSKNGLSTLSGIQSFIRARGSVDYNDYKVLNDYLSNGFEKVKFNPGEKHRIFKALENAKSKESPSEQLARMQALRLFCNQQGDIVALGTLLKSTQKSWLEPFKISESENNETLHKYLVETENDAYTKVVIPLWDNIMADKKGLVRKDLKSFYADIHALQKATNQNQTVSNKVFIPLESGFSANSDTIFFQSGWGSLKSEEYNTLAVLFKNIFGKALPLFNSVPYLKDAPFNLGNTTFYALTIEASKPVSLTDMAVMGKAAHIASLPLFEKFVVEKEATTYILRSKHDTEEMVWCSQVDIALQDHLRRFHKTLIIAPVIPELKDLVALKENELLDFLIEHWEPSNESYTNAFTSVIVTKEDSFKKKLIGKLDTVVYNFEDNSGLTTLNNVVKVALSFSDISTSGDLFQTTVKFVVNAGLSFTLSDIISTGSDTIYFGDENQYQLKLSDIFTSDNVGYSRYIEILIEKLTTGFSYDKAKLSQLFGLKTMEDKEDILARINSSLQNTGYLPNASQLAFLLLYKKYYNKDFDLSGYSIKHQETARKLNGVFALSMHHFSLFHADAYLDERYDALARLLKLTDTTPSFKAGECSGYLYPVIENNVLLCPDLKENLHEDEQIQLLDFLIRYHKNSNLLTYRKTWSAIFGFRPERYNSSGKYMLKEVENFPEHIYTWSWNEADTIKKKHKAALLSALGFNLPWAPINTLREVLINPGTIKTFPLPELNDLPVELVANSLVFLHQNLPDFKFNQKSTHYDLLKEMVKICIQNSQIKIPLPVSTGDKEVYHFVDTSVGTVYYYDVNKYHELDKLGLDVDELIRSTGCSIYNGSHWTESQELKQLLQEIKIEEIYDNDQILHTREEWADTFYNEWKSIHPDILLYYYNNLPVKLLLQGVYIKTICKDKYYFNKNAIHCPIKFSFTEIISTLKTTKWISLNALNDLESLFNMHQMKVAELLNNPIMDTELRKLVEDKRKELEQLAYRKDLIENLSKSEYSLKWFMSFIELQIDQDNESDHSIPEQELSFFHVEWDKDSRRLLNFKDPNRTVTPTIEYCTDFSATFVFNNSKPVELKIQDVSKKGQVLNVMPARPELLQNINLNDIKRVDLRFSRSVDLLRRLLNAFKRLANEKSWQETYNLKDNLSHNIHFIFGPPGTGKTTTIAERITAIMNTDPAAKVLVLTPTNKAADVLTQRIMKCTGEEDYWLVRYGASFANDIIERDLLQNKDSFIYEAYTKCACITTIHRLPYEQAILKKEHNEDLLSELGDMHWDYVIFDESSMIPISYMMYAMYKCASRFENKATAFWVAGDPLQIPPVVEIDDEDLPVDFNKEANIYTMIGLNTFDESAQKAIPVFGENNKIENLTTQYRSIEQIGKLFSEFSYNGDLHHHRATVDGPGKFPRNFPTGFAHLGIKPVTLLKFPVNMDDSVYTPGKLRKSAYHIYSAILIFELVKKFNESLQDNEMWTIGIVCPYRSQATLINKMIESLNLKPNLTVITDTVHGFQGDECDMVYFVVNPPNYSISSSSYGAFIHKHYLINVAISRAKDYLIVLYPDDDTKGVKNLEKLNFQHDGSIEHILNAKMGLNLDDITIHSSDIEEKILRKKGFIQENSRTNKHQLVNVYNLAEKPYIVRESTTAIDIQFKS